LEEGEKPLTWGTVTESWNLYKEYCVQMGACFDGIREKQRQVRVMLDKGWAVKTQLDQMYESTRKPVNGIIRKPEGVYMEALTLIASTKPEIREYISEEAGKLLDAMPGVEETRRLLKVEAQRRHDAMARRRNK
jgi:hypothetical protein